MWAKVNILLVICMLGLFLAPSRVFACHLTPEKPKQEEKMSCCSDKDPHVNTADEGEGVKDIDKSQDLHHARNSRDIKDMTAKDCCKDKSEDSHTTQDHGDDCSKHCGEKSCRTSMPCNPMISFCETDLIPLSDTDQLKLYTLYKQPFCSDAYFSIWQPPKIA
ncbi:hypothetical protein [Sphingobacterium sp. HMA12]|uniref:hypothetical protein n=1 Tax=Sphingobacterium sp. HMA12 TaxID=2050894 RepID=UPI000CE9D1DD|nr:hypothetical protein [Sphingobacterium sp. HMA12]